MPRAHIVREVEIIQTSRVMQMQGLFEVKPSPVSQVSWEVDLPIEERPWQVGLIYGPSGSGKSTVARELFGQHLFTSHDWPDDQSLLDGFPREMPIKEITGWLSRVGFSSPPAWLRPYRVLSMSQRFRADVARALAESKELVVMDEFTSVVDRTVARIGSAAIAKGVREAGRRFIAVSCHDDIIEWLQPDWVYRVDKATFEWRSVQPRPPLQLELYRVGHEWWPLFREHHYLNHTLSSSAHCWLGTWQGRPVAFGAVLSMPHAVSPGWQESRIVCLPDFQGVGIGNRFSEALASLYHHGYAAKAKPYRSVTSNPAMIAYRARSPKWHMKRKPGRVPPREGHHGFTNGKAKSAVGGHIDSVRRATASFVFAGQRPEALSVKVSTVAVAPGKAPARPAGSPSRSPTPTARSTTGHPPVEDSQ